VTQPSVQPKKKWGCLRWIVIIVVGFFVLAVIAAIVNPSSRTQPAAAPAQPAAGQQAAQAPADSPTATPEPPAAPTPMAGLNQDVVTGKLRWNVTGATDLGQELKSDNQFIEPKTTAGKYIAVDFVIENLDTDPTSFLGVDLIDSQERKFGASDDAFMFIDNERNCLIAKMNPNLPQNCTTIFEVPADATGFKLKVTGQAFGSEEQLIDLGF
jgi:hypothetical protein